MKVDLKDLEGTPFEWIINCACIAPAEPIDIMDTSVKYANVVRARELALYAAAKYNGSSITTIGAAFGFSRSTAVAILKRAERHFKTDKVFRDKIDIIMNKLKDFKLESPEPSRAATKPKASPSAIQEVPVNEAYAAVATPIEDSKDKMRAMAIGYATDAVIYLLSQVRCMEVHEIAKGFSEKPEDIERAIGRGSMLLRDNESLKNGFNNVMDACCSFT